MIYYTAGHNGKATGASSGHLDEGEEAISVRNEVAELARLQGLKYACDNDTDSLSKVISWLKTNATKPNDLVIDIHFNSFPSESATGVECFVPINTKIRPLAEKLIADIAAVTKLKNRGVKTEGSTARRKIAILNMPQTNVILIELPFVSNPSDMAAYKKYKSDIAHTIFHHSIPYGG